MADCFDLGSYRPLTCCATTSRTRGTRTTAHIGVLCGDYRRVVSGNTGAIVVDEKFHGGRRSSARRCPQIPACTASPRP